MKEKLIYISAFIALIVYHPANAQKTQVQGNTEINVSTSNTAAIANGENSVARNRVGVIQGGKTGDTKISVNAANVTTVANGRNKKACTNIGSVVDHECK